MHGLLSNLTAAILLAHGVFGCCAHHAHAFGQADDPLPGAGSPCCSHGLHDGSGGQEPRHGEPRPEDCQQGPCFFVPRPAEARIVSPPAASPCALPPHCSADGFPAGMLAERRFCAAGMVPLPVPLYLFHRVLLI